MERDIHDRLDRARAITRENMQRAASGLKQGAEAVRSVTSKAGKQVDGVRFQAGRAAEQANRLITEHPLAAVAAAAAIGAFAAHFLTKGRKSSEMEEPKLLAAPSGSSEQDNNRTPDKDRSTD